jgi:hypothetical protein
VYDLSALGTTKYYAGLQRALNASCATTVSEEIKSTDVSKKKHRLNFHLTFLFAHTKGKTFLIRKIFTIREDKTSAI